MRKDIMVVRESIGKIVTLLTDRKINVTQRGTDAYVRYAPDGQVLQLNVPYLPDDADDTLIAAIQGFLDHEVGHVLHTDHKVVVSAAKQGTRIKKMANLVEDVYVEKMMAKTFPGSESNLERLREVFLNRMIKPELDKAIAAGDTTFASGSLMIVQFRAWGGQRACADFLKAKAAVYDPLLADLRDALGADIAEQLGQTRSSADCLHLAKRVIARIEQWEEDRKKKEMERRRKEREAAKKEEEEKEPPPPPKDDPREESEEQPPKEGEGEEEPPEEAEPGEGGEGEPAPEEGSSEEEGEPAPGDDEGEEPAPSEEPTEEGAPPPELKPSGEESAGEPEPGEEPEEDEGAGMGASEPEPTPEPGESSAGAEEEGEEGEEGTAPSEEPASAAAEEGGEEEEEEDLGPEPEPSSLLPALDEAEGTDFSKDLAKILGEDSRETMVKSDYCIFSTEWDKVEIFEPPGAVPDRQVTDLVETTTSMVGVMAKNLERAIAAMTKVAWNPGLRRGRINPSALAKSGVGDDRLFRKRYEHRAKDTAATLLIDCSGSMQGPKMRTAALAGYALSMVLERLRVPHEVVGFTTRISTEMEAALDRERRSHGRSVNYSRDESLYMPIFKEFHERVTAVVTRRMAYLVPGYPEGVMRNNVDGESVQIAAHRLRQQRASRHVLMVLSDGRPACSPGYGLNEHLQKVVRNVEASGIDVIGIGIGTSVVEQFYPRNVVVDDIKELPQVVISQLGKLLLAV
jgi:cobalamin biosynthesis protein CobT